MRLADLATAITLNIARSVYLASSITAPTHCILTTDLIVAKTARKHTYKLCNLMKGNVIVTKIRPVGDRVVVKPAQREEVTKSGIVIPDTAKEKPQEGTIIAVGSGRLLDNGDRAPLDLSAGDRVLFAKYGGTEFKLDGEEYLVLKENDILAVIG